MEPAYQLKDKRRRGVILTEWGLRKLQAARSRAELDEKDGKRYTLEEMSRMTGLAVNTLMKVYARETRVDKQTLKTCFQAFNLVLEPTDYTRERSETEEDERSDSDRAGVRMLEFPEGQVPLDSVFYVEHPAIASDCYRVILQPGALIRIKAPRRMGKTSLMARVLSQAAGRGYRTVSLSFQLAEKEIFQSLDQFLQWFCANVGLGLQLSNQLADYWEPIFGSQVSCKMYFERYLLAALSQPVVLGLDDVDLLFDYPELASNFFGLLRTWHEEAKNREIWQKLRLIVVHSMNLYIPLNVNKSPFNVGLPVEIPPLTSSQVRDLARLHDLDWSMEQAARLVAFVGGNPYLVRVALYYIGRGEINLEQLLQVCPACARIYNEHLQQQLFNIQQESELSAAFAKVVRTQKPVELNVVEAFKLHSRGLVHLQGDRATVSCPLYSRYFGDLLSSNS